MYLKKLMFTQKHILWGYCKRIIKKNFKQSYNKKRFKLIAAADFLKTINQHYCKSLALESRGLTSHYIKAK